MSPLAKQFNIYIIFLLMVFLSSSSKAQIDFQSQVGRRWMESQGRLSSSEYSFLFALHGHYPIVEPISLVLGPSFGVDHFGSDGACERMTCYSMHYYKTGIDVGAEFTFPKVSVFLHGRGIIYGWGKQKLWGRSSVPIRDESSSLKVFDGGVGEGTFLYRTSGFDITGGLRWNLVDKISCLLAFEFAYEKENIDQANLDVRSSRGGDLMELSTSQHSTWTNSTSSALFLGLAYSL